jgi:protein SCO1/2
VPRRALPLLAVPTAALAFALPGCGGGSAHQVADPTGGLHGQVPVTHPQEPEFRLVDTAGRTFDLDRDTAGRALLLYFGYTHCPDECPATMATLARALERAPADVADKVAVVFVTTDPRRDTPTVLHRWLARFDPSFVGLTGTRAQLARAQQAVGVPLAHEEDEGSEGGHGGAHHGGYAVSHFAAVLAYGRDGRLATTYPSSTTPSELAADLPVLVKG